MWSELEPERQALPLAATIGGKGGIFVVHGGIFSDPKIKVKDIDAFDRTAYPSVCHDDMIDRM